MFGRDVKLDTYVRCFKISDLSDFLPLKLTCVQEKRLLTKQVIFYVRYSATYRAVEKVTKTKLTL